MKLKNLGIYLFVIVIALISCDNAPKVMTEEEKYIEEIRSSRQEKDSLFKFGEHSPIPEDEKDGFSGLKYFEPALKFKINAVYYEHEVKDTVRILTTKPEDIRNMLRYGEFRFKINGQDLKLQAYVSLPVANPVALFIPFSDLTSGKESYEVGRYLEQTLEEGLNNYVLDFNMAYSPYCAYNSNYSCPLVPEENFLNAKISAGEKDYKQH